MLSAHEEAQDSHMYVEDDVAADGSGAVYDEIVSAVNERGVTHITITNNLGVQSGIHDALVLRVPR